MKKYLLFLPLLLMACDQHEETTNSNSDSDKDTVEQTTDSENVNSEVNQQSKISDIVTPLVGSWFTAVKVKGDWYEVGGADNQLHIIQNGEEDFSIQKKDRCGDGTQLNHEITAAEISDNGDVVLECKYSDSEKMIKMIGNYQKSAKNWPAGIFSLESNIFTEIITEGVMSGYDIESVKLYQGAQQGKEPVFYDNYDCETGEDPDEVANK